MVSSHTTDMLLYSSLAGMCKKLVLPFCRAVIPPLSTVHSDPLTSQTNVATLELLLQLKVAVDLSVALTDMGLLTKAAIQTKSVIHWLHAFTEICSNSLIDSLTNARFGYG